MSHRHDRDMHVYARIQAKFYFPKANENKT